MRLMALDIGEKRIGIAVTDELGVGVWPQPTLIRKTSGEDALALVKLIEDLSIQILVVGLPYNMDDSLGPQARKVKSFVSVLAGELKRKALALPVEWCDERLTSWEAEHRLTDRGLKGKKRKAQVDAMAACLILEDYLARKEKS